MEHVIKDVNYPNKYNFNKKYEIIFIIYYNVEL